MLSWGSFAYPLYILELVCFGSLFFRFSPSQFSFSFPKLRTLRISIRSFRPPKVGYRSHFFPSQRVYNFSCLSGPSWSCIFFFADFLRFGSRVRLHDALDLLRVVMYFLPPSHLLYDPFLNLTILSFPVFGLTLSCPSPLDASPLSPLALSTFLAPQSPQLPLFQCVRSFPFSKSFRHPESIRQALNPCTVPDFFFRF